MSSSITIKKPKKLFYQDYTGGTMSTKSISVVSNPDDGDSENKPLLMQKSAPKNNNTRLSGIGELLIEIFFVQDAYLRFHFI